MKGIEGLQLHRQQSGFTYLGLLLIVAVMGTGLAAYGELWSHANQREKEKQLLFVGHQIRDAIASYYNKSPGAKVYPKKLEDLVEDKRFPLPMHHLRRVYADPITGSTEWKLVAAPGDAGIMGVASKSEEAPVKTANFAVKDQDFENADQYAKWAFVYKDPARNPSATAQAQAQPAPGQAQQAPAQAQQAQQAPSQPQQRAPQPPVPARR